MYESDKLYTAGEFAKKAGVTIRTIRYYDEKGLLKPFGYNSSGYRLYSENEFAKLQKIMTLKFLGFSLEEIAEEINEDTSKEGFIKSLSIQEQILENKITHMKKVTEAIDRAKKMLMSGDALDWGKIINIITVINMIDNMNFVKEQYKTSENLDSRLNLHSYNVNETDWQVWCFNHMDFPYEAKVLELGSGNGVFWIKNRNSIKNNWNITLSDLSQGMLESAKLKLKDTENDFTFRNIDVQNIPCEDESFNVVIAKHMLYYVPDTYKALSEIKRVLADGGIFYATANALGSMRELHEIIKKFDSDLLPNYSEADAKFGLKSGQLILEKFFGKVRTDIFEEKIIVSEAEPIVSYVFSTIKGNSIKDEEKKRQFTKYIDDIIKERGNITITTKACLFTVKK